MKNLTLNTNPKVKAKFQKYPAEIKPKLNNLRKLILEAASESEQVLEIEETLKWGEPSYLAKKGSTIRIDWKAKTPHQYAMYFKCTSKLILTFREIYKDTFKFENNRAILFNLEDDVPEIELKECIKMALNYHSLKKLPLLGA